MINRDERKLPFGFADVCRVLLGLTFIFSGFVKTIDPWGTALKITEYLNVYGFGTLNNYRFGFAIWFCAAELMMGLMLTFKIKTRLISIFAMLVMTFFLVLTFLSATVIPVEDCGCFGDALKMSPWASFVKNVVLWLLALVVWLNARKTLSFFPVTVREWVCTFLFAAVAGGLGAYCYRHLPIIDFLPYKVGVNLREAVYGEGGDDDARVIFRDLSDGSLREFAVADTTWYDTSRWEFVEQVEHGAFEAEMSLREFAVFNRDGDATAGILDSPGRVYMLCAVKLDLIKPRYAAKFERVVRRAYEEGDKVVLLTATPLTEGQTVAFGRPVPVYNVDATTMITMLRASVGMVVLEDGVIAGKKNCRDIR
ncbi:MAG: DoxX protein [Alistipes sp.]|jgi:uncharacterized membrane protein YphA (DoxX/SURF4 family)|nr:DoxX protein [Alistipes sp.]